MNTQADVLYIHSAGFGEREHHSVSLRQGDGRFMGIASAISQDPDEARSVLRGILYAGFQCPVCGYWKDYPVGCGDLNCPWK